METKVEVLEGNRARITVTIDEGTVTSRVKQQYRKFANQYNFPGFRKGKAPRPVIDSVMGKDAAVAMVTDELVNETFPIAVDESGIYPVGQPDFNEENMGLVEDKKAYTYTVEIDTKPTPELSSYDPVEIEMPPEGASDEQIDQEIESLLEHYYEVVDAPANTMIKEDRFADIKISATDDNGENIDSITTESMQYGIGSGLLPASFEEAIMGLKKGNTKQFTIDIPSEPTAMTSSLLGKTSTINFDVEVLGVKRKKLPELTDEWVQTKIGVDTVDDLRQELNDEIKSQQEAVFPRLKENRVLNALAERLVGDVPENLVEESESTLLQDFFNQLQRQGLTLDMYLQQQGITSQKFRDDVKEQAADMAKQDLALDAYAAYAGMEATDEDVRKEFEESGVADPEALMQQWRENGQMYVVRQGILRQKAAKELVEGAVVTEVAADAEKAEDKPEEAETAEAAADAE